MTRSLSGLTVALGLLSAAAGAWAAPPTLKGSAPLGARRGVATEVTFEGTNLKGAVELVAPFPVERAAPSGPNADAAHWKATLVVPPETAVGVYPVRVRTEDGISNPLLFSVGQLPQVAEAEDNGTVDTAQSIPAPAVVEGQAAGNDVDFFKFPGKKGQRVVVDAQCARIGSGVDPTIRLTTLSGAYVASADDTPGLLTDARLVATLPEDSDYLIELSDSRYQGGGRPIYRLVVGAVPVAEEVYPLGGRRGETLGLELRGGTLAAPGVLVAASTLDASSTLTSVPIRAVAVTGPGGAGEPPLDVESLTPLLVGDIPEVREPADPSAPPVRAAVPVALNGRIDPAGDEDRFVLAVTPGQKLRIEVDASDHGSALDGTLQILGAKGAVLANADDTAPPPVKGKKATIASPDPSLDFTVPAGVSEITLAFRDLESRGGTGFAYHIRVLAESAAFELALDDAQVSLPRGGTAAVGVSVVRKGYNGPITLDVPRPPQGVKVRPGTIAEGQLVGSLTLTADPTADFGVAQLAVVGQGQAPGADGPITVEARKTIVFATQAPLTTNKRTQLGLVAAPAQPTPVMLQGPESPVEIAHGFGGPVPLRVARAEGADAALTVTSLPLPPGLSLADAKIAEKKEEGTIVVNAAPDAALGTYSIALLAGGKLAGADQTVAVPEITLNVVRPATIEPGSTSVEVKAGEPVEVKGKITRKGTFKDEVTVQLNKLPAGLKAAPVKLAPDQTEFTLKIESDAKAAAAEARAEIALVFQAAKKDYPLPPAPLAVKVIASQ
jgi:hypothetical protein